MAAVMERSIVASSEAPGVLDRVGDPSVGLAIWQRALSADVQTTAARLAEDVVSLRCVVTPERKALTALAGHLSEVDPAAEAIAFDIALLTKVFASTGDSSCFSLRLETVRDDGCRRFHVDDVPMRLVTTYHGKGTQWVPDPDALTMQSRYRRPLQALRAGDVAVFRGKPSVGATVPHRSPPILDGKARLVAVLDPLAPCAA